MNKYAVRLKKLSRTDFLRTLRERDKNFEVAPECFRDVRIEVTTCLSRSDLMAFKSVEDVYEIKESDSISNLLSCE